MVLDMAISLHPSCQLSDARWCDEQTVHDYSAQPTMRASIGFPNFLLWISAPQSALAPADEVSAFEGIADIARHDASKKRPGAVWEAPGPVWS
jgi:hypothetical protein